MLNKLKTWKDKLIDILNGSYKTSRRFMASFSVRTFTCLSLVCLICLFTFIICKDNASFLSSATPNETLLESYNNNSNFLYAYLLDTNEYKFYFKDGAYDNNGDKLTSIKVKTQSYTKNSSSGTIYNYSDGMVVYDGIFNGPSAGTTTNLIDHPTGVNSYGNNDSTNVIKIVGSRFGVQLSYSLEECFKNILNLTFFDGTNFDTSRATSMKNMFSYDEKLKICDVSTFDTGWVTGDGFTKMFFDCRLLEELDVSSFDTSEATSFSGMFQTCSALKHIDVSNFDTSKLVNLNEMFKGCSSLKKLDLSNFNTSKVTAIVNVVNNCTSLKYLDISSWDLSKANITDSNNYLTPFAGNTSLEVLLSPKINPCDGYFSIEEMLDDGTPVQKLPVTTGTSKRLVVQRTLYIDPDTNVEYYNTGKTSDSDIVLEKYDGDGDGTDDTDCIWSLSDKDIVFAYLFNDGTLILDGEGELISEYEGRLGDGSTYSGQRIVPWRRYKKLDKLTKVVGSLASFKPTGSLQSFFSFYSDSEDRDPSNPGTVFYNENVPESDIHLTTIDLTNFDITDVNSIDNLFSFNTAITEIKGIEDIDTTQVVRLNAVFYGCKNLMNLDLRNWNLRDAETFNYLFAGLGNKDTGNKVNINIDGWNVSRWVETANRMFRTSNIGTLSMNGVTNADYIGSYYRMFENTTIDTLDLSSWDINGYDTDEMFGYDNGSDNYFADINTIILPNSIKAELVDTIPLPVKANYLWTGYESDGETKTGDEFTTLPYAGETTNLAMIKSVQDDVMYVDSNNLKFYHDKILDGNNSDNDITSYFNIYKVSLINNYVKLNTGLADPVDSDIENKKLEIVNDKNTIGAYFYMPKDTTDTGVYKNDATLILHGLKYEDKDTTLNIHSKVKVPAENGTAFAYLNSCDVYKLDGGTYRVINETSDPECYHDVSGVSIKNLYGDLIKLIDKAYISLIGYAAPSFSDAFNGASKVTTLDLGSRIDFSIFESYTANRMFQQMSNVTYINMGAFDGNLSQTAYMFYKCTNLETIDNATYMIDSNKAGLKDIKFMFSNCESLKNIDWSHWDVSKINNAEHAFSCMHSIDTFDFSNWDCNISSANAMFAAVKCDNPINFGNMNFDDVTSIFSFYQDATLPYYDYTIFKNSTLQNVTFSGYGNKNIIDFEGVDFSNVNYVYEVDHDVHFGTMADASEIILPVSQYGRVGVLNTYPQYMTLGNQTKKIWQGYSKNSSTGELEAIDNYYVYDGYVPVAGSDYTGTLYAIKQVNAEEMTEIDGKYYYKNQWVQGTTKHNILTYYDVDGYVRPCVWDISKAEDNSIMCYIYDDGTMLFDGAGLIKEVGDGYTNNESIPWRMTYKDKDGNDFIPIDNVTKIIGSNAGFKPEGSLAYYFSPVTIQDTGLKNHIKTVDVTNFDTSKVNCFDFTFSGINNVDGIEFINIDKLNTSMAQSMKSMFEGTTCSALDLHATIDNTDPLNVKKYWDVSKVHDFGNMFYAARIDTVNLDNWNLDSTYTDPNGINFAGPFGFVYAAHIKNLSLNNWTNTSKANPAKFLAYVWELNSVDLSSFNFEINQESVSFLYHRSSVNEIILPNTLSADKINVLSDWDVVQNYGYYGCNKDGEVVTTMPYKYLIGKVDSNGDGDFLDKTDIYMFKLISDTLYTDSDTDISYYRGGTSKSSGADAVTLVKEFDVTNTAGPNNTPAGAVKAYLYSNGLLIFDGEGDIKMSLDYNDLGPSNTEPEQLEFLTDTYRNQIKNIVGSIRGFKPNGTLRYLCYNMDNLETFDGTKFDLTNVNNLMCMFENPDDDGDSKLTSVIFGNTNTNSITSLNSMFDRCKSLTNVNLGNNTFTNVNNTAYMFNDCTSIETIDLRSLNCELTGCKYMFGGTTNLTSVILGDDTNGYNITLNTDDISCMFTNTGLTNVDFTKFKESKNSIKKIEGAAGFNPNTTLINLHGLDLSLATLANQSGDSDADKEKRRLFYSASWDYDDYKDTNTIETIILPSNVPALADALYLPVVTDHVWQGYESDGTTKAGGTFTTLPKAGEVTNLYMIKLVRAALYVDDTDSSNIIEYYSNGTNKADITLDKYDSDNNGTDDKDCIWNLSTDGKLKAYLYTDGTLVLDGEGTIKDFTKGGHDKQILPWREYKKLESLTRVVGSRNGFTPAGSMADFFSFSYDSDGYYSSNISATNQKLTSIDFTNIDTSNVDSFKRLFYNAKKLDTLTNIENINTSNVTNMMSAFTYVEKINNLNLSNWDVSNVTIFNYMFNYYGYHANNYTTFNLSNWELNNDTDKDVTMVGMFDNAYINSIDMSGWTNTDNISKTKEMFKQGNFKIVNPLDLSSIDFINTNLTNSTNTSDMFKNSTIRDIILPNSMLDGVDISLPSFSDKAWMGYNNDTSVGTNSYTKLMAKTNTSDGLINRLKVSDPTLFTIDNISYSSNDKVAEWDISKMNNGSIKAYLFKDPTDSNDLTLVFDQIADKFGSGDDDYNIVKTYSNDAYDNSLHTPWYSYLSNSNNSDKHITKVRFNSDINFEQLNYYFSYMPDLTELDLSHFVCTTEYDANALNSIFDSLNMHIKLNYKFKDPNNKRDFNYTIYNPNSSDFITNEDNNVTLDLSGLTFDNLLQDDYKANDFSYYLYFNKIIVPERMNNYTKNIAALCVNQAINMYEAYNDNGTPLDESDDEFLGYTIYMTDNNHAFDNFSKSVSYLKTKKHLAPYAAYIAYKDSDIDFYGYFDPDEEQPRDNAACDPFVLYIRLLEQFDNNSITVPSNYEFLYDGTGTDPFNTLEDVIDKDVFYSYLVNANLYNYDFISNMFLYMKEKQEENNISDDDYDTLKLYMNEYIHDLFKVTLDNIGTLNYLDELKITVTNGLANVLNNFYKLYEVIGTSPNEVTIPFTVETNGRLNYFFDKSWDEVSDLIKDVFGNDASEFNFTKDYYAPGSGVGYLAYVSNVAGSILPSVFKETDSYYVIKISDTYNSGIILYYYDKLEECMIDIYVLGDNNWIFQDITGKMNLLKSGDSSTLDLANDILSDSDVERLFVKNQIELSSSQDNIDGAVFALADNGLDYDYTNAYIAIPKNPKIYKKQIDNEFTISNTKVGNFVYEIRPLAIDLMKFILDNSGFSSYDPDVKPFNYKRLNVTVNALDISSSNTRVYAGDISSKVFDGVNPITCDSEVHLYYKNNEWQDGDDPIELAQGVDYQITGYSDNDKQGTATIHLQGISPNTIGTRDITFNIVNAIKKLDINDLTLSDSEKAGAIINKDGTDRVLDAISFNDANSNTLHPYILDSDGITPIYLSYTKAYVSDSAGDPKFIARAKDTSDPLAISNITFEGLKLVDTLGAYELYEDNTYTKLVSANNSNDTFILSDSSYLIDNTSPTIDKIIINNSKSNKLKENDTVNVSITFSEELDFNLLDTDSFVNTYKDNIYLSYKIGSNTFDNYKLNLSSIESPRALSDTNRKTIMKFTGKIPNDLGELIDAPFTLYDINLDSITSDEVRDASINELDVSNFSVKVNVPELTGYLVNTKVDEPDPIKPEPEKPITTQTITVQVVKNNKYIEGYSDGTFKPNDNITRGEFSKMLAYISNNYSDSNKLDYSRYINSFKDVNASDWYSSYVGFNNKKQVMVGYSDGTFRPNKELTRAEAAKALTNMFSINTNNNTNTNTNIASTFNNELNGKWYEYSMKKLINAGLLKGYPDGLLRPNDPITRAEMVALINRITNRDINNNAINNNSNLRNIPYDVDSNKWYYKDIISALNDY